MLTDIQSALEVWISLKAQTELWSHCCNRMREQEGKENVDFDFTDVLHLVSWSGLVAPLLGLSIGRWVKWWIFVVPIVFSDFRRHPQPFQSYHEPSSPPNQLLAPWHSWPSKALEGKLYISTNMCYTTVLISAASFVSTLSFPCHGKDNTFSFSICWFLFMNIYICSFIICASLSLIVDQTILGSMMVNGDSPLDRI